MTMADMNFAVRSRNLKKSINAKKEENNMDKKDLGFICSLEIKFPKLNEFCKKHNIDGKIVNIDHIADNTFVTFRFVKDGYDSLVRRYRINDEFAAQRVENLLIDDLCDMDFDTPYLSVKKTNDISMAFDLKTGLFINEILEYERKKSNNMKIKNVIFQDPATIVFWEDGTKTVVRAEGEDYDPEKGLAMAISRKALGNNRDYYNTFIHWLKRYKKDAVIGEEVYKNFLEKLKKEYHYHR